MTPEGLAGYHVQGRCGGPEKCHFCHDGDDERAQELASGRRVMVVEDEAPPALRGSAAVAMAMLAAGGLPGPVYGAASRPSGGMTPEQRRRREKAKASRKARKLARRRAR